MWAEEGDMEIRIGVTNVPAQEINAQPSVCSNGIVLRTKEGRDESPMGMGLTFIRYGNAKDDGENNHDGLA